MKDLIKTLILTVIFLAFLSNPVHAATFMQSYKIIVHIPPMIGVNTSSLKTQSAKNSNYNQQDIYKEEIWRGEQKVVLQTIVTK